MPKQVDITPKLVIIHYRDIDNPKDYLMSSYGVLSPTLFPKYYITDNKRIDIKGKNKVKWTPIRYGGINFTDAKNEFGNFEYCFEVWQGNYLIHVDGYGNNIGYVWLPNTLKSMIKTFNSSSKNFQFPFAIEESPTESGRIAARMKYLEVKKR